MPRKAISAVVAIVLLLMMTVAAAGIAYVWTSRIQKGVQDTGTTQTQEIQAQVSSCMSVDGVAGRTVYLRNCGTGTISGNTLLVYIDGLPANGTLAASISPNTVGTLVLSGIWNLTYGKHKVKITNGIADVTQNVVADVRKDGLVGYWKFDEGTGSTAYDGSGKGNDGTLVNSPAWVDGKIGKALSFSANNYINMPGVNSINSISNTLSFSFWIYSTDNNGGHVIDNINGGFGDGGWFVRRNLGALHSITFEYWQNGAGVATGAVTAGSLNNNQWYFVTGSLDIPNNNITLYVNGGIVGTAPAAGQIGPHNDPLRINYPDWNSPVQWFNGIIDDVKIYNKALTPDDTINLKAA
ncbi:Concanavalin A-like lectin/glucanases superfamily protein [uncultured archaeon]|nr:Concanavalin A-like lectin/glucanases superfamily protein [uncultured archaeon]